MKIYLIKKKKNYNIQNLEVLVELVHKTIRNGLICKYLENRNKFNLCNALKFVLESYNNCKHSTTKFKLIEIFFCNDDILFKNVKENTMCSIKNYYTDEYLVFDINDPILLFNNFELTYNKKNNMFILEK